MPKSLNTTFDCSVGSTVKSTCSEYKFRQCAAWSQELSPISFKIRNELAKSVSRLLKRCEFLNGEEKEDYYDSANKSHSDSGEPKYIAANAQHRSCGSSNKQTPLPRCSEEYRASKVINYSMNIWKTEGGTLKTSNVWSCKINITIRAEVITSSARRRKIKTTHSLDRFLFIITILKFTARKQDISHGFRSFETTKYTATGPAVKSVISRI